MKLARYILTLLLVSCLLLALPFDVQAANSEKRNDVKVTLTTDQSKYKAGEEIQVTVEVQNGKKHGIEGVGVSIWLPNALTVVSGETTKTDMTIAAGETATVSAGVKMDGSAGGINPLTILFIAIGAAAAIGIVVAVILVARKKKKNVTKVVSIFLCIVMALSMLPFGAFAAGDDVTISVDKTITAGGRKYTLKANVTIPAIWFNSQCTVSFDSTGGTVVESQTIPMGGKATMPVAPQREGFAFVGWYADKELTKEFDFSAAIPASCTAYARWVDIADKTDTDGDGLTDPVENYLKTDPAKVDTDGDSLTDYQEVTIFGYDPLKQDTDGNGVTDDREDLDQDTLSNAAELAAGLDPATDDSDGDGLKDNQEQNYSTDPAKNDTDGDGAYDGTEVALGTDPLVAQTLFQMNKTADNKGDQVKPSVEIQLSGSQVETLQINPVNNDTFFPETMPGYLGKAYDFSVEGTFAEAVIHFEFDMSALSPDAEPVICYFNEATQELEELTTTIVGNVASATVNHFSKYILIDRKVYQDSFTWTDVWDSTTTYTGVEIVLVIDDSGSMYSNDYNDQRLVVAKNLVEQLAKSSKVGIVKFASSTSLLTSTLTTDKEAAKAYLTNSYFRSSGNTYMYAAINSALDLYESTDTSTLRMMVVLSDGAANDTAKHDATITAANNKGVKIYTVGLGAASSSYFTQYLQPLAVNTGGEFHLSSDAEGLAEIYKNIKEKIDIETDSDSDGIPDYYEDNIISFNGVHLQLDKNNPDTDGDGLKDGEEVQMKYEYNADKTQVKVTGKLVLGDPTKSDTDGDGIRDSVDPEKFSYTITDRTLSWVQGLSYTNLEAYVGSTVGEIMDKVTFKNLSAENAKYLSSARIIYANDSDSGYIGDFWDSGLGSVALRFERFGKKDAVVYALRGTEFNSDLANDGIADVVLGIGWDCEQSRNAFNEYKRIAKNKNTDYYITGHSLGGRLTLDVMYKIHNANETGFLNWSANIPEPVHAVTFNGLGYNGVVYATLENNVIDMYKDKLTNYYYRFDLVGEGLGVSGVFVRPGQNVELLGKDSAGKTLRTQEELDRWIAVRDITYHGIVYFTNDYDLFPDSKHSFKYWIEP